MKTITTKTQIEAWPCEACGMEFFQPVKITSSIYRPELTLRVPAFLYCADCAVDGQTLPDPVNVCCFECGEPSELLDSTGVCPKCGCGS